MKNLIILFLIFSITGCAALGARRSVSNTDMSKIKNIGVVSLLGDKFNGVYVGTTIFGNESYVKDVSSWNIDDFTENKIVDTLNKSGHYVAKKLSLNTVSADSMYSNKDRHNLDYEKLLHQTKQKDVDTLVIVKRINYQNAPFHRSPYGFYEKTAFGSSSRCVYSLFVVEVYDTESGRDLAWEWGFPCTFGESTIKWKLNFNAYSEKEKELIRLKVEKSIEQNIYSALHKLGW
ncbi:MAG: hypothetical protein COA99_03815 [Moraxellaceae bacterium]|nr:MAG: hypothetical protein COA99_03815 [Moraxellaceae bacterium]